MYSHLCGNSNPWDYQVKETAPPNPLNCDCGTIQLRYINSDLDEVVLVVLSDSENIDSLLLNDSLNSAVTIVLLDCDGNQITDNNYEWQFTLNGNTINVLGGYHTFSLQPFEVNSISISAGEDCSHSLDIEGCICGVISYVSNSDTFPIIPLYGLTGQVVLDEQDITNNQIPLQPFIVNNLSGEYIDGVLTIVNCDGNSIPFSITIDGVTTNSLVSNNLNYIEIDDLPLQINTGTFELVITSDGCTNIVPIDTTCPCDKVFISASSAPVVAAQDSQSYNISGSSQVIIYTTNCQNQLNTNSWTITKLGSQGYTLDVTSGTFVIDENIQGSYVISNSNGCDITFNLSNE